MKRMTIGTAFAAAGLLGLMATAYATPQDTPTGATTTQSAALNLTDKNFITKAAQGGIAEIKLGQLATERGVSDAVKQYGQQMIAEHTKANDELKQVAATKGVTLPSDMDAKSKAAYARLSGLKGAAFDKAYLKTQVMGHQEQAALFQREIKMGQDADTKAFASKTLPTVQEHLQMARMNAHMKSGAMSPKSKM